MRGLEPPRSSNERCIGLSPVQVSLAGSIATAVSLSRQLLNPIVPSSLTTERSRKVRVSSAGLETYRSLQFNSWEVDYSLVRSSQVQLRLLQFHHFIM